jgi:lipoate-protein ligase A
LKPAAAPLAWRIERLSGRAQQLHDASAALLSAPDEAPRRAVRVLDPLEPALVLGSAQPQGTVDLAACLARGVSVARRRSGGGAVLVMPGGLVWLDVFLPAADPLWQDDVGRATWWLGEAWAAALEQSGVHGAQVWKGPMQRPPLASHVCFAGLGPGEVTLPGGAKVVGISQRRSRAGCLFQCACLLSWRPAELVGLLALAPGERRQALDELARAAAGIGVGRGGAVTANLLAALPA